MKVLFVSLGCDKNLVDSEHMLGDLIDNGFSICDSEEEADIIVVNTCSFIADAMEESIQTIIDLGSYKENGHLQGLIVTGCLAQRFTDDILKDLSVEEKLEFIQKLFVRNKRRNRFAIEV